jgi:hypothetical protein
MTEEGVGGRKASSRLTCPATPTRLRDRSVSGRQVDQFHTVATTTAGHCSTDRTKWLPGGHRIRTLFSLWSENQHLRDLFVNESYAWSLS